MNLSARARKLKLLKHKIEALEAEEKNPEEIERIKSYSWPRLVRKTEKNGGHCVHNVCDSDGKFKKVTVRRSHGCGKQVYKEARKARWGQLWPHKVQQSQTVDRFK